MNFHYPSKLQGLFFIVALFFCFPSSIHAQCVVDAGNDTALCASPVLQPYQFQANVLQGTAPFTYTWTFKDSLSPRLVFTASLFLSDTTVANPRLKESYEEYQVFHLEVEDAEGNVCKDSIRLRYSVYYATGDLKVAFINRGDSVRLYSSLYGGIPPLTYSWFPGVKLSDTTLREPMCYTEITRTYYLTVTDSMGCQLFDGDFFRVFVIIASIDGEEKRIKLQVGPNPMVDETEFRLQDIRQKKAELALSSLSGKLLQKHPFLNGKVTIRRGNLATGVYIYQVLLDNKSVHTGKLTIQ